MKRFRKSLKVWAVVATLSLLGAIFGPFAVASAATSADVSVTARGAFVSYTAGQTTYNFGTVAASSTTNTTVGWLVFTNLSSVTTNISVQMLATTYTSTGAGWTHSDTAAGVNTAAMKASSNNGTPTWDASTVFVKFTAPYNWLVSTNPIGSDYKTGLSLLAPTSFTDGFSNNNTVRFTFTQAP